jgi:inosine/xanthosine triphosphatase
MKIAIGTTSKIKIRAVKSVLPKVWKGVELVPVKVDSGVRPQPMSDEEGIKGAANRAKNALMEVKGAAYGIGLEGAVHQNSYGMFLGGWVVIIDRKGAVGIGSSGRALLPKYIARRLHAGNELGPIVQEMMGDSENRIRRTVGTISVLTDGLTDRTEEFKEATKLALAPFISKKLYKK